MPFPEVDATAPALRGDADAWDGLIRLHQRRLLVALLGHGLTIDLAKDAAQEAWAHLISQCREGRLSRLELPGLAIRQALFIHSRREQTERRRAELSRLDQPPLEDPGPEPRLASRQQLEQAQQLLRGEPELNRRIFQLAWGDQLPHDEIAHRLDRSTQRIRQILCELRARLRTAFEESR